MTYILRIEQLILRYCGFNDSKTLVIIISEYQISPNLILAEIFNELTHSPISNIILTLY